MTFGTPSKRDHVDVPEWIKANRMTADCPFPFESAREPASEASIVLIGIHRV